jgi:hypothetical protein
MHFKQSWVRAPRVPVTGALGHGFVGRREAHREGAERHHDDEAPEYQETVLRPSKPLSKNDTRVTWKARIGGVRTLKS